MPIYSPYKKPILVTVPDATFWDGDQEASFTIGTGTITRNTTNNNVRRYIYTHRVNGDFNADFVFNGTWLRNAEQISFGWFRSEDLGSFDDLDSNGVPCRVANSQTLRSVDTAATLELIENFTNQSNNVACVNDGKITFNRTGTVIKIFLNGSLHDTSALTTTDPVRFWYGAYSAAADDDGLDGITITSEPPSSTPVTIAYTATAVSTASATVYTFSNQALGTAASDRLIVVSSDNYDGTTSGITVAGVAATAVVQASGTNSRAGLWQAAVPSGTTGDIVVTLGAGNDRQGIGVWAIYGAANSSANDTATDADSSDPLTVSMDCPANGVMIGVGAGHTTGTKGYSWTNLTENFDAVIKTSTQHTGASAAFEAIQSSVTITCDPATNTNGGCMAAASWGPAA